MADLDKLSEPIINLYRQVEDDILKDIARRIITYDFYIPSAEHQRRRLTEMGKSQEEIMKYLSSATGQTKEELKAMVIKAAAETIDEDTEKYMMGGLLEENEKPEISENLKNVLDTTYRATGETFKNLTATTAVVASGQLTNALDRAWLQVQTGAFDYNTAIKRAIKDVAEQGIGCVKYPSGRVDSIETVVRRAVLTGVNQACLRTRDTLANEMGCDLVEVTAHSGARPDHAEWQGKIYSRSGKSKKYSDFRESTGYGTGAGLGGWNCRHSFFPYIEGMPKTYSEEQLEKMNEKCISYNGKMYTEYEASQIQRGIERKIRRWKRENIAMEAAGEDISESAAKIKEWQNRQADFIEQTGLKRQYAREQIIGYSHKQASKVMRGAKQKEKMDQATKELRSIGINGKINYKPKKIDIDALEFDAKHINSEREHDVVIDEAKNFIKNATVSISVWNGQYERYFSEKGAAYVNIQTNTIRTAFSKDEYDDKTIKMMEVIKKL